MLLAALAVVLVLQPPAPPPAPTTPPEAPKAPAQPSLFEDDACVLVSEGHQFVEGPCWVPTAEGGYFLFCERDQKGGTVWKWTGEGKPEVWRRPSGQAIGTAVDAKRAIYQAESDARRITRVPVNADGTPGEAVVVADTFEGKRLNATNDLVVKSDGSVYFTDPTFFTDAKALELGFLAVFRVSPEGVVTPLDKSLQAPNGLAFSPDEKRLYVNDFRANTVHVFDVRTDGTLENGRVFATLTSDNPRARGRADGLRCDTVGNVYTTGLMGITVFSPAGEKVGELTVPGASNLAFGGKDGRQVLITAGRSVWTIKAVNKGAGR
ncbi:MAG: gluconolactonase [Phycisphaerae bacterium]|nr:MAG: gluconolactonase [Phycisphaerae bacterium]